MTLKESSEFSLVLIQLIELFKPANLETIGSFNWEYKKDFKGRTRKTYVRTILKTNKIENAKSSESWFLQITENKIELIIDFKLNAVPMGEVSLYVFRRTVDGLKQTKSTILSLR